MDLLLLNTNLDAISVIDMYASFIWTDRYQRYGDFELYTPATNEVLNGIKEDYYVQNLDSEHVMIVEGLEISTDIETGNYLTVRGRSLESLLDRRIIWGQTTISGNLQNGVKKLLTLNVINPSIPERKINNFIFEESTDPAITRLTLKAQYTGDNLYDVIANICKEHGIGFKITLNDNKQFVFKLYSGVDRSYRQYDNPYVVFSPEFDNLLNSNYIKSKTGLKNVALVAGEGEGIDRKCLAVGSSSGLDRRELFVDARDISSKVDNETTLTTDEYNALLDQRGEEKLATTSETCSFEGEAETTLMYKYGEDFFNGDIVQIANEYGHETAARITEIIMSENEQGLSVYPTFENV